MNQRPIQLAAGDFSLDFEPWSGWIRNVRFDGELILNAAYAAVRDQNWGTYEPSVTLRKLEPRDGGWFVDCHADYGFFEFYYQLELSNLGLRFGVEGIGTATFETRRTGLCVLVPAQLTGARVAVSHPGNLPVTMGYLPTEINPNSPFSDVQAIAIQGRRCETEIQFSGELFEMEDQRNWSDYSFKVYCRPQRMPQPYVIQDGDRLYHSISVTCVANGRLAIVDPVGQMLELGIVADRELDAGEASLAEALKFDFVDVPVNQTGNTWRAPHQKRVSPGDERKSCRREILESNRPKYAEPRHENQFIAVPSDFMALNGSRPDVSKWLGAGFATHAQGHATDVRTVFENIDGVVDQIRSAKSIFQTDNILVGPTRFSRRQDDRLDSQIGAAWLIGLVSAVAPEGCLALTLIEWSILAQSEMLQKALRWLPRSGSSTYAVRDIPKGCRAIGFDRFGIRCLVITNCSVNECPVRLNAGLVPVDTIGPFASGGDPMSGQFTLGPYQSVFLEYRQ